MDYGKSLPERTITQEMMLKNSIKKYRLKTQTLIRPSSLNDMMTFEGKK